MLSDKHTYTIDEIGVNSYKIALYKKDNPNKVKYFNSVTHNKEGLINHMDSLTETICNDFLKQV